MLDLNSFVLPACLGNSSRPDAHTNEAYDEFVFGMSAEDRVSLVQMLKSANADDIVLSVTLSSGCSFDAKRMNLTDGNTLFVIEPVKKLVPADSAKFVGYRSDSSVAGFTTTEDLKILDHNNAANQLVNSLNGIMKSKDLSSFFPTGALRFLEDDGSDISFTTKIKNRQFEVRVRKSQNAGQLIVRIDEKTNTADIARILKKQMEPYQSVLKTLKIGFFQSTPSGKLLMVNEQFAKILGYDSPEQFLEMVPDAHTIYVDSGRRDRLMSHLRQSGQILDSETEIYRKDGSIAKVSGTMVAVKNDTEQVILIQGTVLDISADTKNDKILRLLKNTLVDVNDSINIADLNDEIIYVNRAFTEMYGYEPQEVVGKKSSIFWSGVQAYDDNAPNVKDTVLDQGGYRTEVINRRKDGSEMIVSLSASVIKDDLDNPIAFIAIARDITADRETEKNLIEAKQKAEEASQLKSVILSNMSHELRTPLTGIIGFASILLEQLEDSTDSDTTYFLDNIKKAGERLLQTMNNILLLAELESRTVDLKYSDTNLHSLLVQCRKLNRDSVRESGLTIDVSCDPELSVVTDKNLLMQIMSPLVDNAIKFTEEGGIILSAGYVDDRHIYISVKDSGIGIDPGHAEKIFEPFTQVSSGIRRKYQGTGLGLHICKRYTDVLGGNLVVISEPEKGAEFKIILPIYQLKA
ncbi:MAG: PAS domain-containing sensor histidine kinase [Balneolia bacterium]|nr:PAS domain-containing sensor histidine kinase [Balneolia bacterium]